VISMAGLRCSFGPGGEGGRSDLDEGSLSSSGFLCNPLLRISQGLQHQASHIVLARSAGVGTVFVQLGQVFWIKANQNTRPLTFGG
jgi:hypothetical protein